jgi:hypothetical protein
MKTYGGSGCIIHVFSTSALVGGECSASRPGRLNPSTHWIGDWLDPRAGLDGVEKKKFLTLPGLALRLLCRLARSQSLYRLSYRGSKGRCTSCVFTLQQRCYSDMSCGHRIIKELFADSPPGIHSTHSVNKAIYT